MKIKHVVALSFFPSSDYIRLILNMQSHVYAAPEHVLHYIPPQTGLLHLSLPLASLSSGKGLSLTEHCHRDQTANENLAAPRTGIEPLQCVFTSIDLLISAVSLNMVISFVKTTRPISPDA